MAFQFPASPTVNQTFTPVAGTTYRWSGTAWHLLAGPGAFITQAEGDARYLQQAGADALYVNVNEVPNIENRIINGKFAIDQRNAGAAVIQASTTNFSADRWLMVGAGSPGNFSAQRVVDTLRPGGFTLTCAVNTADPTPDAGEAYLCNHTIEGINTADFQWGSGAASPITIAFEIQSSLAGTYSFRLTNSAGTRSYVAPFTVNVVNALEEKVFTVPGDTQGVWLTDNGKGLEFCIPLAAGANFVGSQANTWVNGNFTSLVGQVNFMATTGNRFYLRNVRLYKGSVDFGPDRRLYAEELALCQRYFQHFYAGAPGSNGSIFRGPIIGSNFFWMPFQTSMRAAPTMSIGTPTYGSASGATMSNATVNGVEVSFITTIANGSAQIPWTASAEL